VQELVEQGMFIRDAVGVRPSTSSGAVSLPTDLHIPSTVQTVLAARIDRLAPDEKALLQQLSVIGRQFPLNLIRQVIAQPEADLYRLLASLQHKEFLYEQPAFPEVEYLFKHALTQEVAYNSMLIERRKVLHEQTGQAIEQLYHDQLDKHYSELAHHYQRSGNTEKAFEYLHKAGQQVAERSVYAEAIFHFTTALDLLHTLPQTPDRNQRELRLQVALGTPLVLIKGYTAPEVETTYLRARDLCLDSKDSTQLFPVLLGLLRMYYSKGDLQKARELGEQFLRLVRQVPDSPFLLVAHALYGSTLFALGELACARALFERSLALYDPQKHRPFVSSYGVDPGMVSLSSFADLLWWSGYVDQAQEKSDTSLSLAQEMPRPFNFTVSLDFAARRHQFRREPQAARTKAEAAIALATEHGFVMRLAMATVVRGWALTEDGEYEEGVVQIQHALATFRKTGGLLNLTYYLSLLAGAYGKAGRREEGLEALAEAWKIVEQTGERWYEAELYRLRGELTLQNGARDWGLGTSSSSPHKPQDPKAVVEAEGYFLKAIDIAQKQQAKSLELRAVMSLARLWQSQGKQREAHHMLSEVYHWFTEGFDTKDLQEAKALLDELAEDR
jgi:predicted ATPase